LWSVHAGGLVDEATPPVAVSERSCERLDSEHAWEASGHRASKPVAIFRLSGIYGPRQNALVQMARLSSKLAT